MQSAHADPAQHLQVRHGRDMHLGGGVVDGVAQGEQHSGVLVGIAVVGIAHEGGVWDIQPCAVRADVARPGGAVGEHGCPDQARLVACAMQESYSSTPYSVAQHLCRACLCWNILCHAGWHVERKAGDGVRATPFS